VHRWSRAGGWRVKRPKWPRKAHENGGRDLALAIGEHNEEIRALWSRVVDAVAAHLEAAEAIDAKDLDAMARVIERIQRGERLALGADLPGSEARKVKKCSRVLIALMTLS